MSEEGRGTLREWDDAKGYGFVAPDDGGPRAFLHVKALRPGQPRPAVGARVGYRLARDERGRPQATDAVLLEGGATSPAVAGRPGAVGAAPAFPHAALLGLAHGWPLGLVLPAAFAALWGGARGGLAFAFALNSLCALMVYAEDKWRAQRQCWRVPEFCLHMWELLGGWPGALVAQRLFRHKRSKLSYQIVFWLAVAANLVLVWLFFARGGAGWLDGWLSRARGWLS